MVNEYNYRVLPEIAYGGDDVLCGFVAQNERISVSRIKAIKIVKRSIDARQRQVMVNVSLRVWIDEIPSSTSLVEPIDYKPVTGDKVALVVGAGPAGLSCALRLIEYGIKPIVFERGKNVVERRKDLACISRENVVDPNSNYCFGEGGAGAYSDGKLYTRSKKRGSVDRILKIFYQHGAAEDILIDAHPHIGTDRLPVIIENIRNTILRCGGEVHFETRVTALEIENNVVTGLYTEQGDKYSGPVVLATGHSARDVFEMLKARDIEMQPKGIAVGVRLKHPQHLIDCIQYHNKNGRGKYLPAAEYNFVTQVDGRGVYSFCMCPGGFIVPAASSPGQLVVNGMSPSNRGTRWANSGMVVEVRPEDLPQYDRYGSLKMMYFQLDMETECFKQAGNTQNAGAQRMIDFVEGKDSTSLPKSSYVAGVHPSRLDRWLPDFVGNRLRRGFVEFGKRAKGFLTNDAIIIGVETRTSSPVRIPRDKELYCHIAVAGLYPCGEGAGYAGGIVSAAIDGENVAQAIAARYGLVED